MAIQLLDKLLAEQIAAGEVVERPSSVIKELVENAIDAGSTSVQVEIERGGVALMRVSDNGGGIPALEIPLAFLRHATSKVRTQEDLQAIQTLGFRGEALASIASVAQVEMLSATADEQDATLYRIYGGVQQAPTPDARPVGTTITVRNLFFNTPARMKFLKKDASEGMYVTETVTRLALSHPQIAFRFLRDGKMILQTPGDGKLETAAYAVLGGEFAKQLVAVRAAQGPYVAHGLITSPLAARASRSMQFFYINGRFVKNGTMMAALEQAYRGMTMQGKFPGAVLFLDMPAELVDVNVHPAKTQVRFAKDKDVFNAVYAGVKAALLEAAGQHRHLSFSDAPPEKPMRAGDSALRENKEGSAVSAGRAPQGVQAEKIRQPGQIRAYNEMVDTLASDASFVPYETARSVPEFGLNITEYAPQEQTNAGAERQESRGLEEQTVRATQPCPPDIQMAVAQTSFAQGADDAHALRFVGEVFRTYILAQAGDTLCIIDKHAAHERLLYEKLISQPRETAAQQLLAPVSVEVSAQEKNALIQNKETLLEAGIELDDFGAGSVLVRSVPADIETESISDLVVELGGRLAVNAKDAVAQKQQWVLHSIACRAAVKAGDKTPSAALLALAQEILAGKVPPFCPHGRPVVMELTKKELEKQFGRLG